MKIRLVVALIGLTISFAVPAFAQQKDTVDTQIIEQLAALGEKYDEAFNNGDAVALAATFTEDAVLVNDTGPVYGREAIGKYYAELFKQVHFSDHICKSDQYSPHIIGTAGTRRARQQPSALADAVLKVCGQGLLTRISPMGTAAADRRLITVRTSDPNLSQC